MPKSRKDTKPYAHIPLDVIESEAVSTLRGKAFLVLVRIAANYRTDRNGMLTASSRDHRGIVSQRTLYRSALPQLLERGLVVRTLVGRKNVKSRYALGWMPIGDIAAEWLFKHYIIRVTVDTDLWRLWKSPNRTSRPRPDFTVINGGRRADSP